MGKRPSLSPTKRAQIVALQRTGLSQVAISHELGISRKAVQVALKKFEATGSYRDAARSGRPRKTSKKDDRVIRRLVFTRPTATTADVQRQLATAEIHIHRSTISRRLKAMNLKAFRPARKPLLTPAMRKRRLQFAKAHRHWTAQEWRKVLWSDECSLSQFGRYVQFVRRPSGYMYRYAEKYTQATMKHPPSIMVWACISASGRGGLEVIPRNSRMDSKMYMNILEKKLENFLVIHDCDTFMQDSAPCHVSKVTKAWFARKNIHTLDWPGNSPDLNPIENVWRKFKDLVAMRKPSSLVELEAAIKSVWTMEITPELCTACVESMPQRLQAVIDAKGGPTKY